MASQKLPDGTLWDPATKEILSGPNKGRIRIAAGNYKDKKDGKLYDAGGAVSSLDSSKKTTKPLVNPNLKLGGQGVGEYVNADGGVADKEAGRNVFVNNPDYEGPDGTSKVTIGPDGKPTLKVTRSQSQEDIANGQDALSNMGLNFAQKGLGQLGSFDPNLTPRTTTGDLLKDRANTENAVYSSLTQDLDQQEGKANASADQQLANRGIPYSADPNSQYQQMKGDITKSFGRQRLEARNQATITGGNEYRSDAGLNETQRANDYSQQSGAYNTNLNAISTASTLGGGLRANGAPGFTGAQTDYTNPSDLALALKNLLNQKTQADAAKTTADAVAKKYAAGDGSSTTDSAWGG